MPWMQHRMHLLHKSITQTSCSIAMTGMQAEKGRAAQRE